MVSFTYNSLNSVSHSREICLWLQAQTIKQFELKQSK